MKKTAMSLIAAITAVCAVNVGFAASFSDISGTRYAWCAPQIEEMASAGYVHGYEDGTYRPDNEVTKLEGIALFARAMGSEDEINEEIMRRAHSQYDSSLAGCGLSWGEDELAYMLYKGAFTAIDLTTYVTGDTKNEPLTRGEAAVIITKAMGGESEAVQRTSISLSYKDARSIPTNILQYVQYVTDKGIMNGIDDAFCAGDTVTRAQIAVILARASDVCDFSFTRGKFIEIDEDNSLVTIKTDDGSVKYSYADNTMFTLQGDYINVEDIPKNAGVIAQLSGETLVALDILSSEPEETITVVYSGYSTSGGVIQLKVRENSTSQTAKTYTCIEDVPITYKGSPATIKSLKSGDSLQLEMAGGKVQSIVGVDKTETVTGATIESIDISGEGVTITISSSNKDYDGNAYKVSDNVTVKKGSKETDLANIYVGDKVTLTLKYGLVTEISATSTYSSASGTIVSVTIAERPSIIVRVDGKEKTYQIPQDCEIIVNQAESSLYDLRVGDNVTVTTQSGAVTKIQTSASVINTGGGVNGTVSAINSSYGFISVITDSSDVPYTVFKTSNSTTVITTTGKTLDFKSIKIGDTVECRGKTTNGAFVATLIIVNQN